MTKRTTKTAKDIRAACARQIMALERRWRREMEADPKLGGEKLSATVHYAQRALAVFLPDVAEARRFGESPLGNNPEVIAILARAGRRLKRSRPRPKRSEPNDGASIADKLYGR